MRIANLGDEECIVDTGFTGSRSLRNDLFTYLVDKRLIDVTDEQHVATVAGMRASRRGRLSSVNVADFETFTMTVTDGGDESRIGLDYLRQFRVTFQLSEGRMFLAKGADFNKREHRKLVGIGLLRINGKTVTKNVRRNSAAERAGILINDELISVAGKSVAECSLGEVRSMLQELPDEDGELRLGLR